MVQIHVRSLNDTVELPILSRRGSAVSLRQIAVHTVGRFDAKRLLDVIVAMTTLIVLSPLFLIVAVIIKLSSRGGVFFTPQRIGKDGVPFTFFKFRSMRVDTHRFRIELLSENVHGNDSITFKLKHDPRTTCIGRVIRKLSIDELPQLWNVLKGDMSLVGPRPPIAEEVARYRPEHHARLSVLPGITCFWQVYGRANLAFEEQFQLDLRYIRTRTFWLDVRLLVLTIPAVLSCKGAY
jgi:lipopolysaccharide/colanic/teichoic acid biosynthesis glycosyltransferase